MGDPFQNFWFSHASSGEFDNFYWPGGVTPPFLVEKCWKLLKKMGGGEKEQQKIAIEGAVGVSGADGEGRGGRAAEFAGRFWSGRECGRARAAGRFAMVMKYYTD